MKAVGRQKCRICSCQARKEFLYKLRRFRSIFCCSGLCSYKCSSVCLQHKSRIVHLMHGCYWGKLNTEKMMNEDIKLWSGNPVVFASTISARQQEKIYIVEFLPLVSTGIKSSTIKMKPLTVHFKSKATADITQKSTFRSFNFTQNA